MNSSDSGNVRPVLNLLVAHPPEAKPLLRQFNLRQLSNSPHPLYANDDGVTLAISGNGARAMSMACAHLAGWQMERGVAPAWLNIGIAGHGTEAVGTGLVVNKIHDRDAGKTCYPTPVLTGFPVTELLTVSQIERAYEQDTAYDMEGAAFWEAASRYGELDLVQLFKIVSDNPQQHVDHFDIEAIPALFMAQEQQIAALVHTLQRQASQYLEAHALPEDFDRLIGRIHFSATQRSQLRKLFYRWMAFGRRDQLLQLVADISGSGLGASEILRRIAEPLGSGVTAAERG